MKNFQGLHKCATGAVINTEDFMKSNQSNKGSMLTGINNASIGGDDYSKQRRKARRKQGKKSCGKGFTQQ
jgi:hypothetical protein